jgi:hypothetical protein
LNNEQGTRNVEVEWTRNKEQGMLKLNEQGTRNTGCWGWFE